MLGLSASDFAQAPFAFSTVPGGPIRVVLPSSQHKRLYSSSPDLVSNKVISYSLSTGSLGQPDVIDSGNVEVAASLGPTPAALVAEEDAEECTDIEQEYMEFIEISIEEYLKPENSQKVPTTLSELPQENEDDDEFDNVPMPSRETLDFIEMVEQFEGMSLIKQPVCTSKTLEDLIESWTLLDLM